MTSIEHRQNLINAQYVQLGLLPKQRHFDRLFSNSFALYLPKEIVSGDFYWVGKKHNMRYLVVGDCTGHGVSASLTSVLALNLFEYIIMNKGIKRTHHILAEMDKRFIESFMDVEKDEFDNPWIDLAIVAIDDTNQQINFCGANSKLLHVEPSGNFNTYKSKGYPIGGWQIESDRAFETITIPFKKGDQIYLSSDGYKDQFGGERNKKFSSRRLHGEIIKNSSSTFSEQRESLIDIHSNWKGQNSQTDDICIVGVEL
jgi:serine phosphatase RsbU (regulator of sigma subunit)